MRCKNCGCVYDTATTTHPMEMTLCPKCRLEWDKNSQVNIIPSKFIDVNGIKPIESIKSIPGRETHKTDKGYVVGAYTEIYSCSDFKKPIDKLGEIEDILCPDNAPEISIDELREMCKAKREERMHIASCEDGETVYTIEHVMCACVTPEIDYYEVQEQIYDFSYFIREYGYDHYCKTVFLTREAAEAALAKEGDKNEADR